MATRFVIKNKLCRSKEESVRGDGKVGNKKSSESAYCCSNSCNRADDVRTGTDSRDGEMKDLLLLGLFCFCLLVLNVACWSFFGAGLAGR